jgi:hypothetical protein
MTASKLCRSNNVDSNFESPQSPLTNSTLSAQPSEIRAKIVQHDRRLAGLEQTEHHVAADIASAP